jgi:hypothetical protein
MNGTDGIITPPDIIEARASAKLDSFFVWMA